MDPTVDQVVEVAGLSTVTGVEMAIDIAGTMVGDVLTGSGLSDGAIFNVHLFLAAHFATLAQQKGPLETLRISEATERYHNIYGPGLLATWYGQQAILLDTSGTLGELAKKAQDPKLKALFTTISMGDTRPRDFD